MNCNFAQEVSNTILEYCPTPINSNFILLIGLSIGNMKWYITGYPLEKTFFITWSIWIHRNNITFRN